MKTKKMRKRISRDEWEPCSPMKGNEKKETKEREINERSVMVRDQALRYRNRENNKFVSKIRRKLRNVSQKAVFKIFARSKLDVLQDLLRFYGYAKDFIVRFCFGGGGMFVASPRGGGTVK